MKFLFSILCLLFCCTESDAQIILTQAGHKHPRPQGNADSFRTVAALNTVPAMPFVIQGWWDLSTTTYNSYYNSIGTMARTNPGFPSATFQIQPYRKAANIGLVPANSLLFGAITPTGYLQYGMEIDASSYGIGFMTSVNTDSVWLPDQNLVYSSVDTQIKFPATYGSSWKNNFTAIYYFQLSATPYSVVKAPAERRLHVARIDSVVGYGKMRIKNPQGGVSDTFNVLQVKTITITIDSIYVSGSSAPSAIPKALGMKDQGQRDTVYALRFFRAGVFFPLVEAEFKTNSYSNTNLKSVSVHQSQLKSVSVKEVDKVQDVRIYPNPLTGRMLTVEIDNMNPKSWKYELINVMGQTIAKEEIRERQTIIYINNNQPAGIYYLRLQSSNSDLIVKAIDVVH